MDITRQRNRNTFSIGSFLGKIFLEQKLDNWIGYILTASIAIIYGYLIATQTFFGIGLFGVIISFFVVLACMLSTEAGLYINMIYSFFAFHLSRYLFDDNFPVGVGTDVLIMATFLGLFIKQVNLKGKFNQFLHTPVVTCILILVFYIIIEFFNPYAHSFEGGFQTLRRFLESIILFFVAYVNFSDYNKIKRYVIALFILATITGLYGCIQQWHGLFGFETNWVLASEKRFGLIYINGNFRKFSTMSDPTAYSVVMASCAVFFLILAGNQRRNFYKLILIAGSIFMLLGMAYTGTRTASVMAVGGIAMFVLLTFDNKNTRIFALFAAIIFGVLIYGPFYGNATLNRFRTSFIGAQDESYKVREVNRAFIQPYIYSHPIGGGLGTTGGSGLQYYPDHYLAGFPPDSGYLKKALETGWIGLALNCILYFVVLKYGIKGMFRSKNRKRKLLYAAAVSAIFSFYIAEFAQEAIGQITDMVVYYPLIAILLRLRNFDEQKKPALDTAV